jgi:F-type H+-transporting ATPase subunit epsilon
MLLEVSLLNPQRIIFQGKAKSVVLPGEQGVFEILPFHKPILSRLISGSIFIDEKVFRIRRGIVKGYQNQVRIIVEE